MAHTDAGGENSGQSDLLRAFEDELTLFEGSAIRPPGRKGAGRPPGSVNRTTTQLKKLLLQRGYRDPAEFLASIYTMDVDDLSKALACDKLEAVKVQIQAANGTLPYFHQRMPQETDQKPAEARPLVMIVEGGARVGQVQPDGTLSIYDPQQNQQVSESDVGTSHDCQSHDVI